MAHEQLADGAVLCHALISDGRGRLMARGHGQRAPCTPRSDTTRDQSLAAPHEEAEEEGRELCCS